MAGVPATPRERVDERRSFPYLPLRLGGESGLGCSVAGHPSRFFTSGCVSHEGEGAEEEEEEERGRRERALTYVRACVAREG